MARAKRHYIPGLIWHLTHRCHKREFLLKFARDRERWLFWLFQAKKKYNTCILNYALTSNHIHLLVFDKNKRRSIPSTMNLVEARTAQEYNQRKKRRGAFWEDRYHATAVESGSHLIQCMIYIDLNMVRAGVVNHPEEWAFCGFREIQSSKQRYTLIDVSTLIKLLNLENRDHCRKIYKDWIDRAVQAKKLSRESKWTESIAVGSKEFIEKVRSELKHKARGREIIEENESYHLRETQVSYKTNFDPKMRVLREKK